MGTSSTASLTLNLILHYCRDEDDDDCCCSTDLCSSLHPSSPARPQMLPSGPEDTELGGDGCNDFCCGCEGECKDGVGNLGCDWVKCAVAVAECIESCCEGSCITDASCIGCLGNSYETCKDCWSLSEGERFRNLIIKGATSMKN